MLIGGLGEVTEVEAEQLEEGDGGQQMKCCPQCLYIPLPLPFPFIVLLPSPFAPEKSALRKGTDTPLHIGLK